MKRKTLPHNPKYPLKSFRVIEEWPQIEFEYSTYQEFFGIDGHRPFVDHIISDGRYERFNIRDR